MPLKDIDYFFEWISPSEMAEDFGISEKRALQVVKDRGMRTRITRHGDLQIFGEDLKAYYDELKQSSSSSKPRRPHASRGGMRSRGPGPGTQHLPESQRPDSRYPWGSKPVWIPEQEIADMLGYSLPYTRRLLNEGLFNARWRYGKRVGILQLVERYLDWKADSPALATMLENGITHVLTFDVADFAGFPGIHPIHPNDLLSSAAIAP